MPRKSILLIFAMSLFLGFHLKASQSFWPEFVHSAEKQLLLPVHSEALPPGEALLLGGDHLWSKWAAANPAGESREVPEGDSIIERVIHLDGDSLRMLIGPDFRFAEYDFTNLLEHIQQLKPVRGDQKLRVELQSENSALIPILSSQPKMLQPYQVFIPKHFRLEAQVQKDVLTLKTRNPEYKSLKIYLRVPFLPDGISVDKISCDLGTGKLRIETVVFAGWLKVVLGGQLYLEKSEGLEIWDSLKANWEYWITG